LAFSGIYNAMDELWDKTKVLLVQLTRFKKRNRIKRYGFPIVLAAIVFFIKQYFHWFLGDNSAFLLVSLIVASSSWFGGLGPGIFATVISSILTYVVFLTKDKSSYPFWGDLTVVTIFFLEGVMISIVSEARFQVENQKSEFIAFIAHELKNPLAAIRGFAGLITKNAINTANERVELFSEKITIQSQRILELVNDLLDITKIEIGKFSYTNTFFNMQDLVKEIIMQQHVIVNDRIIELHGSSKKVLYGDRYRIGQVLINLLTNALKYSPETKKVVVRIRENSMEVGVSIRDYGLGISREEQKKIFERYYRTIDSRGNRSEGMGLGLFISQQIIMHHNGRLWVKSREGKGSTFYISLPAKMTK